MLNDALYNFVFSLYNSHLIEIVMIKHISFRYYHDIQYPLLSTNNRIIIAAKLNYINPVI